MPLILCVIKRTCRILGLFLFFLQIKMGSLYTKTTTDYDLYGIKVAMNDQLLVSVDNLNMVWYVIPMLPNSTSFTVIHYNQTTCDFVNSVVVPFSNILSFVYNCIDNGGRNLIGFFNGTSNFSFVLINEQNIMNYSIQENFVINIDGETTGVYGIADDFLLYYDLNSTYLLSVWTNMLNISPRSFDIGSNMKYGVVVGYCQSTSSLALECGLIIALNRSLSCPERFKEISISNSIQFPYSDLRTNHHITNSRDYSSATILSVSITWYTRRILIGIPSLNIVLLYSFDDPQNLLGSHQNGIGLQGFGKSVSWLDEQGEKAVILANSYSYVSYQWFSSSVHLYDIHSDGLTDETQPILIYPNSQQILFPGINPSLIRSICSASGHLTIFDILGNTAIIYSSPEGTYPDTNSKFYTSIIAPCIDGTYRNYPGIELCFPCPNGTYSTNCSACLSNDSFCPMGSIEEISYSILQSIEQDQDYPESPENIVFDDILTQSIFSLNTRSFYCVIVSPITWVILFIIIGLIVAIGMTTHEIYRPKKHTIRDRTKEILRKIDLIREGQLWIGGLISAAIIILLVSAYVFSNKYYSKYPIEKFYDDNSFPCDVTLRNAKFSTTIQKVSKSLGARKEIEGMFDLLNSQLFTLNINLIQTAFNCNDSLIVQHLIGSTISNLSISKCQKIHNNSILSLAVLLPTHTVDVRLSLFGLKTIGGISLGLSGPSAISTDGRYTLMEPNFTSTFVPSSLEKILASSSIFSLQLTQIINRTAPLYSNDLATYSAIWSSSFKVEEDQLFVEETRYTYFRRIFTNVTVNIDESLFYVSNIQEPIARRTEIVFHSLLFTTVVLHLFSLMFLLIELLVIPGLHTIFKRARCILSKNQVTPIKDNLSMVIVKENKPLVTRKPSSIIES